MTMSALVRRSVILSTFLVGAAVSATAGTAVAVYLPYAAVGAILILRRPGNPIGWLLAAIGWVFALGWLPVNASVDELHALTAPPIVLAIAWFKWWWSMPLAFTLIAALAISFPAGRLPRGRWRRPGQLLLATMVVITVLTALWPSQDVLPGDDGAAFWMPNPVRLVPVDLLGTGSASPFAAAGPPLFALLIASITSTLVRYRRSGGMEKLQLRWLVAGLGSVVVAVPLGFVLLAAFGTTIEGFAWLPATVAFALPPIAIGIAVTRYRLYEIDRLLSRGLSWAVLSALLVAVYTAGVLLLQDALAGVTQGQTLAVAASTLLAAALFQPLRRRVQRAMDHRFDRARYDGERTAAKFAERLRQEVDLGRVSLELVAAAQATVRPEAATVWLRGGRP
ncbi:MAG: hypothetical protein WEE50_11425 [Chloroflexota bacterium]